MKKIVYLFVLFSLVTGCKDTNNSQSQESSLNGNKEKKLTCTKDISTENLPIIQTANMLFIDNKIENINTTILVTLNDSDKSLIDSYAKKFKANYEESFKGNNHVELKVTKKSDREVSIDINFDYKNMTDKEKEGFDFLGNEDYELNKTQLEKSGYICK